MKNDPSPDKPTKTERHDQKRRKEKNQTPHHGRSSLRIREQAEQKREKQPKDR